MEVIIEDGRFLSVIVNLRVKSAEF